MHSSHVVALARSNSALREPIALDPPTIPAPVRARLVVAATRPRPPSRELAARRDERPTAPAPAPTSVATAGRVPSDEDRPTTRIPGPIASSLRSARVADLPRVRLEVVYASHHDARREPGGPRRGLESSLARAEVPTRPAPASGARPRARSMPERESERPALSWARDGADR